MNTRPLSRLRRAAALIAGLAVASVALSGCLYAMIPEQSARPAGEKEPDTEGVAADLLPYYSQKLDWTECGTGFECTDVTAPLDWENPGSGEIQLAVVRHRAEGTAVGSLLTNPGGPGASGVDLVLSSLGYAVGPALVENYD
ncbi:MAG: alpha/beta hydrolase, partial [Microbacterium sp.]|nr:alpha/beta hydrolase [Microbacterium sp.]